YKNHMKISGFNFNKKNVAILLLFLFGIIFGSIAGFFIALTKDLPQIRNLESLSHLPLHEFTPLMTCSLRNSL
ncbi:MAG: hypothetical protein OER74_14525, partial [Desulfobacteraceae bacterium]|nr:hypothetical protein [Desulfobacteraceae bacterium]